MYEETESGELSKEEFERRHGKKQEPKSKAKAVIKKLFTKKAQEPVFPEELDIPDDVEEAPLGPQTMEGMKKAEEEVRQRQIIEWKESRQPLPESQPELDYKLLSIEARLAKKKELMKSKDSSGVMRNTAIELEEDYPEIFTEDMVKGNYGETECACIFGNGTLINAMKTIGQAKDFSFVEASRFNKNQMNLMINISRGRSGFSAVLSKTDKHVSEGLVSHIQRAFIEKKEKKWGLF